MKRPVLLFALLFVAALTWGGLLLKDRQERHWVASARREELEKYVADHPDRSEAMIRLAALLRNAHEREKAEELVRRAVEIAPQDDANWVEFGRTVPDDREAIQSLEGFLKIKPNSTSVMAELAERYLQAGDMAAARSWTEKAMRLSPDSPEVWRVRGDILAEGRQLPEAESAYRKALALRNDPETRLSLAHILIPLQRYPEILALCAPIVKARNFPGISSEQRARALLYTAGARLYDPLTAEELAGVQEQLREADALSTSLPQEERFLPPYFLGESFLRAGKPAEAIPYLERSVATGPMFAGSLYSLARAYRLVGDTAKADAATARHTRLSRMLSDLEMYSHRLEERPDDAEAELRLADTLKEAGHVAEAARLYQRLIQQGRFVPIAQRKLNALPLRR